MRNTVFVVLVVLGVGLLPQIVLADSTEYNVAIDATWSQSALAGPFCSNCSQITATFNSTFDVYAADGTLVPGTMVFSASSWFGPLPFTFDPTPPTYTNFNPGLSQQFTSVAPFNWTTTDSQLLTFAPNCVYSQKQPCVPGVWPPTGDATLDASTVALNCFASNCSGIISCAYEACGTGGDVPADGGSVVVTKLALPAAEPSSLSLSALGSVLFLAFGILKNQIKGYFSVVVRTNVIGEITSYSQTQIN